MNLPKVVSNIADSIFSRLIKSGIELAVESLIETGQEITVLTITNMLNKMKWMGNVS